MKRSFLPSFGSLVLGLYFSVAVSFAQTADTPNSPKKNVQVKTVKIHNNDTTKSDKTFDLNMEDIAKELKEMGLDAKLEYCLKNFDMKNMQIKIKTLEFDSTITGDENMKLKDCNLELKSKNGKNCQIMIRKFIDDSNDETTMGTQSGVNQMDESNVINKKNCKIIIKTTGDDKDGNVDLEAIVKDLEKDAKKDGHQVYQFKIKTNDVNETENDKLVPAKDAKIFMIEMNIPPEVKEIAEPKINDESLEFKPEDNSDEQMESVLDVQNFSLFPNPNGGQFTLSFETQSAGDLAIRILDIQGNEVFKDSRSRFSGQYKQNIDLSGKGKGTYVVEMQQNGKTLAKKVVVE